MPRAVAVNVAANTNVPGFRGPVYPDGSFAYVPIPEPAATLSQEQYPVDEPLPTYDDLDIPFSVPTALRETPVHMDPEFQGVHGREHATYGDPYAVKAGRIADLSPGDWLLFYATLSLRPYDWRGPGGTIVGDREADERDGDWFRNSGVAGRSPATSGDSRHAVDDNLAPDWGAYLFAGICVEQILSADDGGLDRDAAAGLVPTNAHLKRDPFDARVVVAGDPVVSGLFDRVVPLSTPETGANANEIVTELSSDSGNGPWWRRPLRFDATATATLFDRIEWA